jgi:hypothetical protein
VSATLVIQSHRKPLRFGWLRPCIDSVENWSRLNGYRHRFIGDEIFDLVEPALLQKISSQTVIASDLARLCALRQVLQEGFDCVVWCDADFLVFEPDELILPPTDFAFGREVWVQRADNGKLRAYSKIHNAFMMFRRGNSCLDFYLDSAQRLLSLNRGGVPPQFVGPKLLTALHNIAHFPVIESAAMLSPLVLKDLLAGGGESLDLLLQKSAVTPAGANLGSSLTESEGFTGSEMQTLIRQLLSKGV